MHSRNIALTTLAWALMISLVLTLFPQLSHFDAFGLFYFPAIFLAIVFSGGGHSPSELAGWSSFLVYTLAYWALLLAGYALLLEIYLVRQVLHHLDDTVHQLTGTEPDSQKALEKLGLAIAEVEAKRRTHFLLQNMDQLDIKASPHRLAAHALSKLLGAGPVKSLMKHLENKLSSKVGPEKAAEIMSHLVKAADRFHSEINNMP